MEHLIIPKRPLTRGLFGIIFKTLVSLLKLMPSSEPAINLTQFIGLYWGTTKFKNFRANLNFIRDRLS